MDVLKKIKYDVKCMGSTKRDNWDCVSFVCTINSIDFSYSMGLACIKKKGKFKVDSFRYTDGPVLQDVLHALVSDADCAIDTFEDFCGNLGYDTDSRKAPETYLACQDNGNRLRKALGNDYLEVIEYIRSLDL